MGRKATTGITAKQKETLEAIQGWVEENGYPPSMQELAELLGISHASAHERIGHLVNKGYLSREDGKARSLSVSKDRVAKETTFVSLPILGQVAAGMPVLSEENKDGEILVDASLVRGGDCFALYASGKSMIEAGINSGDLLIVRSQQLANDGDIVVALLNGEATVKTLRWRNSEIALIPENKRMKPIPVSSNDDLRIVGKVISWQANN